MRSISDIAREIQKDWKPVNFAAKPYLMAMLQLDSIDDKYLYDSGRMIVGSFLSNASSWRGDKAKEIKKELLVMLKSKPVRVSEGEEGDKVKEKQDKEKELLKTRQEKEQEAARKKDFEDGEREREQKKKEAERKKKLGIR